MTGSKWTMRVPAGKDGRPIRIGDVVHEDGHGLEWHVKGIGEGRLSVFAECNSTWVSKWLSAEDLMHVEPEPDADEDERAQTYSADRLVPTVAECASDKALEDAGLVRLPVDADGEVWHPGDEYDSTSASDGSGRIEALVYHKGRWYFETAGRNRDWHFFEGCIHRKLTLAERIRAAVGLLADEDEPQDARALKDLLAVADELEGGAE